ncbi:MAG: hypothetical protein LBE74_08835, partial [Treponema sp.]|nr:hypothetical protein [Treponema sp.]
VIEESKKTLDADLSGSMGEIALGMDQISAAIHRAKDISGENKRNIDALAGELSKFRTHPPPPPGPTQV